jgi:hypothetical protein
MYNIPGRRRFTAAWGANKDAVLKLLWILYHGIYTSVYTRYCRAHISMIAFE